MRGTLRVKLYDKKLKTNQNAGSFQLQYLLIL